MTRRPNLTHKVKATECGGARRGHALSGSWAEVDCPECLKRRPQPAVATCCHCERPINGSCVHLNLAEAWLHDTCVDPFKRTPAGRSVFANGTDPYAMAKCPRCGRPGVHPDGRTCK